MNFPYVPGHNFFIKHVVAKIPYVPGHKDFWLKIPYGLGHNDFWVGNSHVLGHKEVLEKSLKRFLAIRIFQPAMSSWKFLYPGTYVYYPGQYF